MLTWGVECPRAPKELRFWEAATGGVGRALLVATKAFLAPAFLLPPALEISPRAVRLRESARVDL